MVDDALHGYPFDPDWTVHPREHVKEALDTIRKSPEEWLARVVAAKTCASQHDREQMTLDIVRWLKGEPPEPYRHEFPMPEMMAITEMLVALGYPTGMAQNLYRNWKADVAAGKKEM